MDFQSLLAGFGSTSVLDWNFISGLTADAVVDSLLGVLGAFTMHKTPWQVLDCAREQNKHRIFPPGAYRVVGEADIKQYSSNKCVVMKCSTCCETPQKNPTKNCYYNMQMTSVQNRPVS